MLEDAFEQYHSPLTSDIDPAEAFAATYDHNINNCALRPKARAYRVRSIGGGILRRNSTPQRAHGAN